MTACVLVEDDRVLRLAEPLPPGALAYVDAGAVASAAPGEMLPAVVAERAEAALATLVAAAPGAAEVAAATATRVRVLGDGLLARAVRLLLHERRVIDGRTADVVVDAQGDAAEAIAALRELPRLGTLVLAAPLRTPSPALDLYADLHAAARRIVGVATPATAPPPDAAVARLAQISLLGVADGTRAPAGAAWYAVG